MAGYWALSGGMIALSCAVLAGCTNDASPSGPPWAMPGNLGSGGGLPAGGSGGGGGGGGGGHGGTAGGGTKSVTSPGDFWGMVGFEDPVAISLFGHVGCFSGTPTTTEPGTGCGVLRILGSDYPHFTFAMSFSDIGRGVTYGADVYASADGRRLAGSFISAELRSDQPLSDPQTWYLGYAWLPLDNVRGSGGNSGAICPPHTLTSLPVPETERSAAFELAADENQMGELVSGKVYHFSFRDTGRGLSIVGDLGAFFDTELSWDEGTQTLAAGPVAETRPGYPIALSVHYDAGKISDAVATTAGGGRYRLTRSAAP